MAVDFLKLSLDHAVERVRINGRAMPASREDRQRALTILEWAHEHTDAAVSAPDAVRKLQSLCSRPLADEAHWRTAFDLALEAWKADRDRLVSEAF